MSVQDQLNQTPFSAHLEHCPLSPPNVSTPRNVHHLSYRNTTQATPANILFAPAVKVSDFWNNQTGSSSLRLLVTPLLQ